MVMVGGEGYYFIPLLFFFNVLRIAALALTHYAGTSSSSSAFSLYPGGNAYVTAFNFPPFRWPHSDFGEGACLVQRFLVTGTHLSRT
jgi:hypothetical protein